MGGLGSGFHVHVGAKRTVEECLSVSAGILARGGVFRAGARVAGNLRYSGDRSVGFRAWTDEQGHGSITFTFTWHARACGGQGWDQGHRCSVGLTSTTLPHGGRRWWFLCPFCDRRRGKLYLPSGDAGFACRVCHELAYQSTRDRCPAILRNLAREVGASDEAVRGLMRRWRKGGL
jgi:hypothetical protein